MLSLIYGTQLMTSEGTAITTLPELDAAQRVHTATDENAVAHIEAEVATAGGWLAVRCIHGARVVRARPRLLQRGRDEVRRGRGLRHRARDLRIFLRVRSPRSSQTSCVELERGPRPRVGKFSNSARARGALPARCCGSSQRELQQLPASYSILEVSADLNRTSAYDAVGARQRRVRSRAVAGSACLRATAV